MNERAILATAFDKVPNGFMYYRNAFARGVPVSAAERELYLSGAKSDWWLAIHGREATAPRRAYLPTLGRMLAAIFYA